MYAHGPSLMPNAIDTNYSRGHPLLFYAAIAIWMKIFDPSHFSQHAFSLVVSLSLLVSVYEVCNKLFSKTAAVMAVLVLCVQTIFLVQTSFVLPEIMVALFTIPTLYFYAREKYLYSFIFLTTLLFTKESGMVLGLVLGIHSLVGLFNSRKPVKNRIIQFVSVLFPGLLIAGFFLLQKKLNGWYLFPEHTGMISMEWGSFFGKIKGCLEIVYFWDNRPALFLLFIFLSLAAAISLRKIKYAAPVFSGAIIYILFENSFPALPGKLAFALLMLGFLVAAYLFIRSDDYMDAAKQKFIGLSFLFLAFYLCFSSINFMTPRYLIVFLALNIMLMAYYADLLISKFYGSLYYVYAACAVLIGLYGIKYDTGLGDTDIGSFDAMTVQEDAVRYMEGKNVYNDVITCGSFQDAQHLLNANTGFLHGDKIFKNVKGIIASDTKYVLVTNIEPAPFYDKLKNDSSFRQIYKAEKNAAWEEIYQKVDTTYSPQ